MAERVGPGRAPADRAAAEPPVLIAGAGPVAMITGLLLARFDVPSILLEQKASADRVGSKAICFQRDVLDIFDRVGIAEQAVAEGVTWRTARTYFRDAELFSIDLPDSGDDSLPPFINLSQSALERYLHAAVERTPLVEVRWDHQVSGIVEGLADDDGRVVVEATRADGTVQVEGSHLVGADGARSTTRSLMGATFDGHSFDEQFLIADIEADLGFAAERRFYFDPPWNPGRQVLVHQQPAGIWRIDWQVPADFVLGDEMASGGLDARIRRIVGDGLYRIDWLSAYRFHQRLASAFQRGRVFLAGDAAHLMSPFGARGLNSGAQDAENLAWKLAWHRRGWAGEGLLASYTAERRPAAEENLRVTDQTMRFLVPRDEGDRAARTAALEAAAADPEAASQVDSGKLAEPFWYTASPLTTPRGGAAEMQAGRPQDIAPGVLCPDHPLPEGGRGARRLRQHFGRAITLLAFGDPAPPSGPADRGAGHGADVWVDAGVGPLHHVDGDAVPGLREALGVPPRCQVVVRPDGHIAAIAPDDGQAAEAVRRATGRDDEEGRRPRRRPS